MGSSFSIAPPPGFVPEAQLATQVQPSVPPPPPGFVPVTTPPTQVASSSDGKEGLVAPVGTQVPTAPPSFAQKMLDPSGFWRQAATSFSQSIPSTARNVVGTVEALAKTQENLMAPARRLGQMISGRPDSADNLTSRAIGSLKGMIPQVASTTPSMKEGLSSAKKFGPWLGGMVGGNVLPLAAVYAGARLGGVPGAGIVSYLLNAGELYNGMREKGIDPPLAALTAGIPITALDMLEPLRMAGGLRREVIEKGIEHALSHIPKSLVKVAKNPLVVEGGTEMAQKGIEMGTEAAHGIEQPEIGWRLLEAGISGAVLRGVTHGLSSESPHVSIDPKAAPSTQIGVDVPPPVMGPQDINPDAGDMLVRELDSVRIARSEEELAARILEAAGLPAVQGPESEAYKKGQVAAQRKYWEVQYRGYSDPQENPGTSTVYTVPSSLVTNKRAWLSEDSKGQIDFYSKLPWQTAPPISVTFERGKPLRNKKIPLLEEGAYYFDTPTLLVHDGFHRTTVAQASGSPIRFYLENEAKMTSQDREAFNVLMASSNAQLPSDALTVKPAVTAPAVSTRASEASPDASDPALSEGERITAGISDFGYLSRTMLQLRHLGWRFPDFTPLQDFIASKDRIDGIANRWKVAGDKVLESWRGLGRDRARKLNEFALEATTLGDAIDRGLTPQEAASLAKKVGIDDDTFVVWQEQQAFFRDSLEELKQAHIKTVSETVSDPENQKAEIEDIERQYVRIAGRTYFPLTRFGQYMTTVYMTTPKGRTILAHEQYESRGNAESAKKKLEREYSDKPVKVGVYEISTVARESGHIPPVAAKRLIKDLNLSSEQVKGLEHVQAASLDPRSFLQHLKRRKGTPGFSRDSQRAFASYVQTISNHIAKMQEARNLQTAVTEAGTIAKNIAFEGGNAIDTNKLHEWMESQRKWILNPKVQGNNLAGAAFAWYFAGVPKQVLVNMTQVPMVTYPVLSHAVGDAQALKSLTWAMHAVTTVYTKRVFDDTGTYIGPIKPHQWAALERAEQEGVTDQTYAAQVAAFARAAPTERLLTSALGTETSILGVNATTAGREVGEVIRFLSDNMLKPFAMSEQWNRRVTLLAAFDAFEKQGHPDPYDAAKQMVLQTQGSYETSNRAPVQQGMLATALIFKSYAINQAYLQKFSPARRRLWLALGIMGGLLGLTGAEHVFNLLDLLGTWAKKFFGMKNPRVDLRHEIRMYVNGVVGSSDWFMHGATRLPGSIVDLSGSISMGRIIPMIDPAMEAAQGDIGYQTMVLRMLEEATGVVGSQTLNMTKALLEDSSDSDTFRRVMMAKALVGPDAAYRAARQGGVRSGSGDKLIDIDTSNPWHWLELMTIAMGGTPPRLAQAREKKYAPTEMSRYYTLLLDRAVRQYEKAVDSKEPTLIRDASKELHEVQLTLPPGFQRTRESILKGLHMREKRRSLRERGLPTEKRLREVYEEWSGAVR